MGKNQYLYGKDHLFICIFSFCPVDILPRKIMKVVTQFVSTLVDERDSVAMQEYLITLVRR